MHTSAASHKIRDSRESVVYVFVVAATALLFTLLAALHKNVLQQF